MRIHEHSGHVKASERSIQFHLIIAARPVPRVIYGARMLDVSSVAGIDYPSILMTMDDIV